LRGRGAGHNANVADESLPPPGAKTVPCLSSSDKAMVDAALFGEVELDMAAAARHPHDATVARALFGQAGAADSADGEELVVTGVTATRLAAFVTARRLRQLNQAFRALWFFTRLHREVWRRGHRAVLAAERAFLPHCAPAVEACPPNARIPE
jgi:hypothetical protein